MPGKDTLRYGGNTNCVTLQITQHAWLIFDAGSGIKRFAEYLATLNESSFSGKLFISHPHWDHINALPYFDPLYVQGNTLEVFCGCEESVSVEQLVFGQMQQPHFPITVKDLSANIIYHRLQEQAFNIDDIHIQTIRLNHPGYCLGYRVDYQDKSFCYITDNEIPQTYDSAFNSIREQKLVEFLRNVNVLVIDSAFTEEEYLLRIGWGHSSVNQVVALAHLANVKKVCLFHHCLNQKDQDIDAKFATAQSLLAAMQSKTECLAPHEGDSLII